MQNVKHDSQEANQEISFGNLYMILNSWQNCLTLFDQSCLMFKLSSMQSSEPVVIQTRSQSRNEMNTHTEHLCIGQIEASTSPPGQPSRAFDFFENYCSNSPLPEPNAVQMPYRLGSVQVIKCPHPGDISQAHKWQKDGRNAFSCPTKSW